MKLHDLQPAAGAHKAKTRVGRGIAAGKGKTAGRGTKGQKARAGGSIPPWFEGGQTPLHMRIPKLRGFKNRAKVVYEIVNVGDIAARIDAGAFAAEGTAPKKGEQLTINADILRAVGLVRDVRKPLKVLGNGELSTALFVVADAFTKSATAKIEAAGGAISVLEVPATQLPALGVDGEPKTRERRTAAGRAAAEGESNARARRDADAAEAAATPAKAPKAPKVTNEPAPTAEPAADASAATIAEPADTVADASGDEPADAPDAVADETPARADAADGTDETTSSTDESA
jgi:large subunit ribosomal protein L15